MTENSETTVRTMVDIACCFVAPNRPPRPAEAAALERFLTAMSVPPERLAGLLKTGLTGKRPRPTLNAQLAALRATLSGDERLKLMQRLYGLMFAIDGQSARLVNFTHFVGAFLGVRDGDLAALRNAAAAELTPRTPEDG